MQPSMIFKHVEMVETPADDLAGDALRDAAQITEEVPRALAVDSEESPASSEPYAEETSEGPPPLPTSAAPEVSAVVLSATATRGRSARRYGKAERGELGGTVGTGVPGGATEA